ncbi:hypothetical protein BIU95_00160 [Curtobacterium sp. MCBA15_007]|uniref:hypothetical protein n=1 Tax=Curtobacterium TaxID=2034 RepID=UPI00035DF3C5|nr:MULTISPECIES: hypothetical protein [Curtobacterium]EYT66508.1 hypothetical protein H489_0102830 [Curtobacterium flaccumfaciens UCD-AKU]OII09540.1 hypothetical protein BIU95_00160 [Curtobacterium sp. MCBA15_007]
MAALIQAEITSALHSHRLVSATGWRQEHGTSTYTCSCGESFDVDPRSANVATPATLLAEHQAQVLERMGFARRADAFDASTLETLVNVLIERKRAVTAALQGARRSHSSTDERRLLGAEAELATLLETVHSYVGIRTHGGQVELPIDRLELSVA